MITILSILLLSPGCSPPPNAEAPPSTAPVPDAGPQGDLPLVQWSVDLSERPMTNGKVRHAEQLGRMAVAMEAQLYRSVVVEGPAGRPPGVRETPWTNTFLLSVRPHDDGAVEASLCQPDGVCEIHFAEGPPEHVGTSLAHQVLEQMGVARPVLDCLSQPPSPDAYATLLAGRSAAVVYGWHPPSSDPGDVRVDPIARAVFLDPKAAVAQWLQGRVAFAAGDIGKAVDHLHFASRRCAEHEGFAGDEALAYALDDQRKGAFPADARFLFARLDAGLRRKDVDTYARSLAALQQWPDDPRLEQRAADAAPEERRSGHLARWAQLDPGNPVPVQRLAERSLRDRDWEELVRLCDELEHRGIDVASMRTPALLALGRIDEARAAAPAALAPRVAARAGAQPVGDSPEEQLLRAQRLLGGDPVAARRAADQALAARPYWPEALDTAARAARAAGQSDARYLARLAEAEP